MLYLLNVCFVMLTGVISTLCAVPKKEGYRGLYKGNGAMMIRIFPYGAIQFTAFGQYKEVILFFFFTTVHIQYWFKMDKT